MTLVPVPKGNRRTFVGEVVSDKSDKTIVVKVQTIVKHPLYKKYIRQRAKFMAHDPENECHVGDKVQIFQWNVVRGHEEFNFVDNFLVAFRKRPHGAVESRDNVHLAVGGQAFDGDRVVVAEIPHETLPTVYEEHAVDGKLRSRRLG